MDRRIRPIGRAIGVPVLHRVDVHVIDMAAKIIFIADQVFPKTSLPYAALTFATPRGRNGLGARNRTRKGGLDQTPATGKIGVAFRQRPYRVHVVRQDNPRDDRERIPAFDDANGMTQDIDVFDQQTTGTISQIDREEIRPARDTSSSILHPCISPCRGCWASPMKPGQPNLRRLGRLVLTPDLFRGKPNGRSILSCNIRGERK